MGQGLKARGEGFRTALRCGAHSVRTAPHACDRLTVRMIATDGTGQTGPMSPPFGAQLSTAISHLAGHASRESPAFLLWQSHPYGTWPLEVVGEPLEHAGGPIRESRVVLPFRAGVI